MDPAPNAVTGAPVMSPYGDAHLHGNLHKTFITRDEAIVKTKDAHVMSRSGSHADGTGENADMTVLADGNVMKVQKSRQRKVFSCVACHKKKIKCSRDHPICQNCLKTSVECMYYANKRVSRGGRRKLKDESTEKDGMQANRGFTENKENSISYPEHSQDSRGKLNGVSADLQPPPHDSTRMSVSTSGYLHTSGPESLNHDGSIADFTSYSGSLLTPETNPKLPGFTENGFTSMNGDKVLGPNTILHAPEPSLTYNGNAEYLNNPRLHHVPSTDSASKMTSKFFQPGYTSNPGEEHFSLAMGPMCFTPLQEIALTNGMKSPPLNVCVNGKNGDFERIPADFGFPQNLHTYNSGPAGPDKQNSLYSSFANFLDSPSAARPTLVSNPLAKRTTTFLSTQEMSLNPYTSNPATTVNFLYGTNVNYHNGDIFLSLLEHLPTKERSFELVERYLHSVHELLPVLVNVLEFVAEHDRFWTQIHKRPSSQKEPENFDLLLFYTLYFPVVYASTISEFEEYDNLLLNQDIDKYLKAFNKICQHYNYPHGLKSISLLLGNVIIQSTSPNPSTMEMSQIIRYAKFLQLHKDPVKTLRIKNWKVVGFRRKLWWVIFGLDAISSHNFCLPPVCRFSDFNVEIPEHHDPIFNENGTVVGKKLNVSTLAMTVKFHFDIILSDLVYQLHNGLATNISSLEINTIRSQISSLFVYIHQAVLEINAHYKKHPPRTVTEMNMFIFVKHHSWSFADRALMLLHKKILLSDRGEKDSDSYQMASWTRRSGTLSLSEYEDTFGRIPEANIIKNFHESSVGLLQFSQTKPFSYDDLQTNLMPSILHNLNDFLKYNDFIKFGKFNWYVKRTIPLDSIILLFVIMSVKLKYEYMGADELVLYVKLVNKTLFILNRKYFKNEKYKRMLSLTNTTWEYILKKYNVLQRVTPPNGTASGSVVEFLDHQVAGILNMSELFTIMDVPQPAMVVDGKTLMPPHGEDDSLFNREISSKKEKDAFEYHSPMSMSPRHSVDDISPRVEDKATEEEKRIRKTELLHLDQKIYYDLRNNFVDINDYCTFYSSLENVLHALMDYINDK